MHRSQIEVLLGEAFPGMQSPQFDQERGCWRVPLGPEGAILARLTVDGGWGTLEAHVPSKRAPLASLHRQHGWPGNVKHIETGRSPALRADVPLVPGTASGRAWTVRQLRASSVGLRIALELAVRVANARAEGEEPADAQAIALACTASGWNAAVAADDKVRIGLLIRGVQRQVLIEPSAPGLRVSVTLVEGIGNRVPESCRAAVGVFLMRASTALRWARAFVRCDGDALGSAGFECWVAPAPDEQALCMAVDILIAACELFGRETEVLLEDPDIALQYLQCAGALHHAPTDISSSCVTAETRAGAGYPAAQAALA